MADPQVQEMVSGAIEELGGEEMVEEAMSQ
jgi:hypothetical protein